MKSCKLIAFFLASAYVVSAAPYFRFHEPGVYDLSDADVARLRGIIATEDNPQLLSEDFGHRRCFRYDANISSLLTDMIEHNRFRSFMLFFPHVNFGPYANARISRLFDLAARTHLFEICDYLLTQVFPIGDGWYDSLHTWDNAVLRALIAGHQDRISELAPDFYNLMFQANAEAILTKLDIIEYCKSINRAFAENNDYRSSNLFLLVIQNDNFDDADMARILEKVLSMGPDVDPMLVQEFQMNHANFEASNQLLSWYLETPVKEPGMD